MSLLFQTRRDCTLIKRHKASGNLWNSFLPECEDLFHLSSMEATSFHEHDYRSPRANSAVQVLGHPLSFTLLSCTLLWEIEWHIIYLSFCFSGKRVCPICLWGVSFKELSEWKLREASWSNLSPTQTWVLIGLTMTFSIYWISTVLLFQNALLDAKTSPWHINDKSWV